MQRYFRVMLIALAAALAGIAFPARSEPPGSDGESASWSASAGIINVKAPPYSAAGDGVTDDTKAIQAAWDAAKRTGARVVLPPGDYRISLRGDAEAGYRPALHFSANGDSKERQPMLEGAIDCDSLVAPAIYLHRVQGYTFINPRFYQRHNDAGSRTAIEMTAASRSNLIINPGDDGSGPTGELADDIIDDGENNEVQWPGRNR